MLVATYASKKALKAAVGKPLRYEETSAFAPEYTDSGKFCVVGPGAYERKWYAQVTVQDGKIVRVS